MKTVFVVMERYCNDTHISKIFETKLEASEYEYDSESINHQMKGNCEYWTEEWEVS